jgi:outer membrane protein assembly factor BamC
VKNTRCLALLMLALLLVACSKSVDRRYLDAELNKPLDMPPDLMRPETQSGFDLPNAFSGSDPSASGKASVLATVDSVKLQGSYNFYWLDIELPADNAYQLAKNFWASEGYGLVVDEPVIGIMQTEWIYREEGGEKTTDSWWKNLFSTADLAAAQDQFRTRIERNESGESSRIYLTHRGTEYAPEIELSKSADETASSDEWQFRRSEPALEVEMLSRLMIYLGLPQDAVAAQLAKTRLFKPRANLQLDADEKSPFLMISDPYQIAWNRVRHALEIMNFDIEVAEFARGFGSEGVFIVKARIVETDDNQGIFSLSASDELKSRKFTLVLTEETHELTRLVIEDSKGNFDVTPSGAEFASLLLEQVK